MITASQLYDYISCPHRVTLDAFGDTSKRDPINPFLSLLWERGNVFEKEVVEKLPDGTETLSGLPAEARLALTSEAMQDGRELIYGGRIETDNLLGDPDLLIRKGNGYVAADIKSGRGEIGGDDADDGKLKPHYAVQVALYTDILERQGQSAGRYAEIWDIRSDRIVYDLTERRIKTASETWWDYYLNARDQVERLLEQSEQSKGALSSHCNLCHWQSACRKELVGVGDLSLIPQLGRKLRDTMDDQVSSISDLAAYDPEALIDGKKTIFKGLGPDRLKLFHERAKLLTENNAKPFLRKPVSFPATDSEIFFDIEDDPMRGVVYLHGCVERIDGDKDHMSFTGIFADDATPEAEGRAFAKAIAYFRERPDATVYYYSKHERTQYRKLQARHPEVCSAEEVEELFLPPRAIDLYFDVVTKATEWPTYNHSIKTLAKYLGFSWRDTDPSGAASIEWFHRWVETGDAEIKQRILDYNEDDCLATAVLLDGIRELLS